MPKMNPRTLKDNNELYEYLVQLVGNLERGQYYDLAEIVNHASRFASGSASEFMHEAQLALERVKKEQPKLSSSENQDVDAVLSQIKESFRKIGGA